MKSIFARLYRAVPKPLVRLVADLLNARFSVSVAGVFFTRDGKVLILQHVYRHRYPWGLPAGFIKAGETPEAAIIREVKEETGLDVTVTGILSVHPIRARSMEVAVAGSVDAAQSLCPKHEIIDGAFVAPDALPADMLPSQAALVHKALSLNG